MHINQSIKQQIITFKNHINLHFKNKQSITIKSIKFISWENISCKRKNTLTEIAFRSRNDGSGFCRIRFVTSVRK